MKIVHIESGLGNQMLSYCEYLAIKKMNPNDDCYIETIVYDIPECNEVICQWNGYELDRIFHINAPNIRSALTSEQWEKLMSEIRSSQFWLRNWNYPVYFTQAFNHIGIPLRNIRGDFEKPGESSKTTLSIPRYKKTFLFQYLNYLRKRYLSKPSKEIPVFPDLFVQTSESIFTGQQLTFKFIGTGIEKIESEVRKAFTFPELTSAKDMELAKKLSHCQSVAIHARRGDMLSFNFDCYYGGYFKRAMGYLRQKVSDPHFFIFCDPGSVEWAKNHFSVLGLEPRHDDIQFVDWNKGDDSWRDMQLMSLCKHQIITRSSFGWWSAWLNSNPDKITCSPTHYFLTTHHF